MATTMICVCEYNVSHMYDNTCGGSIERGLYRQRFLCPLLYVYAKTKPLASIELSLYVYVHLRVFVFKFLCVCILNKGKSGLV